MHKINIVQAVASAFTPSLHQHLAARIGLAPDVIEGVIAGSAPSAVIVLMAQCVTRVSADSLYAVVTSTAANARIVEQLGMLADSTAGMKDLETRGDALMERATQRRVAVISDEVALRMGVPPQATHVLTAHSVAVLFGVLKHHLLVDQAETPELVALLGMQLPMVTPCVTDSLAQAIGYESATGFVERIEQQLSATERAVSAPREYGRVPSITNMSVQARALPISFFMATYSTSAAIPQSTVASSAPDLPCSAVTGAATSLAGAVMDSGADGGQRLPVTGERKPSVGASRRDRRGRFFIWLIVLILCGLTGIFVYDRIQPGFLSREFAVLFGATENMLQHGSSSEARPVQLASVVEGAGGAASPVAAAQKLEIDEPVTHDVAAADTRGVMSRQAVDASNATRQRREPAALAMRVDEAGTPILEGTVHNEDQRRALQEALVRAFGAGHFRADILVNEKTQSDWIEHLDVLISLMTQHGAELSVTGTTIVLAGTALDGKHDWVKRLRQAFGPGWEVVGFSPGDQVTSATRSFHRGIATLLENGRPCAADEVQRVLNDQVIEFARSGSRLRGSSKETLDASAALLKSCASVGHQLKLDVDVFTDSAGDARALELLSQKRADTVRSQLIEAGVPKELVTAKGHGGSEPVQSNITSIGRFANRRVLFEVHE